MRYPEVVEFRKAGMDPSQPTAVYFRAAIVAVSPDNVIRQNVPTGTISHMTYRMLFRPLPAPHRLAREDFIRWRGITAAVLGEPMIVTMSGRIHHIEAYLGVETPN